MKLSVVLPCFNEEQNIASAVSDTALWLRQQGLDSEIIVVNDGSLDGSREVLSKLQGEYSLLRVVTHDHNQGYGVAVRAGCDTAKGDAIAFMDSDGQFHAEDLGRLLPYLREYAFVTGRRHTRADPFIRNLYGKLLGLLTWAVFGLWMRDINCGLKIFRRELWPKIRPVHGVEKLFNTELFLNLKRLSIAWKQVPVTHYPRLRGSPTGGSLRVIKRMFRELYDLKKSL